ncbi:hypothetical protein COOONC_15877 [Cooperia oncophora]
MLISLGKFALKMATNAIDMLSSNLNRLSREHRYVAYVLSKEKEKLKEGHSQIVTKFVCQFTIFEFNSVSTQSKQVANPLTAEKVLGVQRQSNFAAFDVPLLFALFFHRYMLRKLGLWKGCESVLSTSKIRRRYVIRSGQCGDYLEGVTFEPHLRN